MGKKLKKTTVLVVEDNPLIALDAAMSIEEQGFACALAHDPDAALRLLEEGGVDCAILDFELGNVTSVPVAKALDAAGRPYVVVTGRRTADVAEMLGERVTVLSKPADYARLVRQLTAAASSAAA